MGDAPTNPFSNQRQLELVRDIAAALNVATDVNTAMQGILPKLSEVFGLSTAWAFRFDAARSCFVEVGASGLPTALAKEDAKVLKTGWCECQDQFISGDLDTAVNIVRCSRLRDAVGDTQGLQFHASIPLRSKGKPLGILNVAASGRQVFTPESLALLEVIGNHVAVAVDRSALLTHERTRTTQLRSLLEMAADLTDFANPATVLQSAVERFARTLGYDACGIVQPSGAQEESWELIAVTRQPRDETFSEYSYDTETEAPRLPDPHRVLLDNARSFVAKSIRQTPYEVRIESPVAKAFSESDVDLLDAFALHLSGFLQNARLYRQSVASVKWGERRKLAADLHDAVSQRLFSASLIAKAASLVIQDGLGADLALDRMSRVQELLADSQREMRSLIKALRPTDDRGLITRLEEKLAPLHLQAETEIEWRVECARDLPFIPEETEALLCLVDEAMHNVLKHAQAKHVAIVLRCDDLALYLIIRDDGIGFEPSRTQHGVGTSTMQERLQQIGGTLSVESTPGKGTVVRCKVPFNPVKRGV